MGSVAPGKAVTRILIVKGAAPFRIVQVKSSDKRFQCAPPEGAGNLYRLPVTFTAAAGEPAGRPAAKISIETDAAAGRHVDVGVSAEILPEAKAGLKKAGRSARRPAAFDPSAELTATASGGDLDKHVPCSTLRENYVFQPAPPTGSVGWLRHYAASGHIIPPHCIQEPTMQKRIYNFSPGPAVLPLPALEEAQRDLMSLPGAGVSILEISHRSKPFDQIIQQAEANLRKLLGIPDNYRVLFLQGGAFLQFGMIPMNFLRNTGKSAEYIVTGTWSKKASEEAKTQGNVHVAWDGKATNYDRVPQQSELKLDPNAAYVYMTSNETIQGVQYPKRARHRRHALGLRRFVRHPLPAAADQPLRAYLCLCRRRTSGRPA